jgi:ATP-dependent Clp protease protease subunit
MVPTVDMPPSDPARRLLDRRTVMVSGRLDHAAVSALCAELMALDGRSGDGITLIVNSRGGPATEILAVLDVLDLMRAEVAVTCLGATEGTAAVLLAGATGTRRAGRNARVSLRVEAADVPAGSADEMSRRAAEHGAVLRVIAERLAAPTGQAADVLLRELESGSCRDAAAALAFGLVDHVIERP